MVIPGSVLQASKSVLQFSSPLTWLVINAAEKVISKSDEVSKSGNIVKMEEEARRQEIETEMTIGQAKLAQEISIARRIDTAEEVIIEEYYDYSGEGGIGIKFEGETLAAGISGSGKRVSKRVYTFKGYRDGGLEALENLISKD